MKTMDQTATAARFLLGGIGTGNISIDQNARLTDFEIFNAPNKGFRSPYTFFAVHTSSADGVRHTKALESQLQPPFLNSHGFHAWELGGLPRFKESRMVGEYPFLNIDLIDDKMPIQVSLEAFTPFIPLNTDDSSLPCAILRYHVQNISETELDVSVAGSFANLCNYTHCDIWTKPLFEGNSKNQFIQRKEMQGVYFTSEWKKQEQIDYMDMALLTSEENRVSYLEYWNEGAWWDGLQDFWNDFSKDGELTNNRILKGRGNRMHQSDIKVASVCIKKSVLPFEDAIFEFLVTWHHPNRYRSWFRCEEGTGLIRNYYAKFGNSLNVGSYVFANLKRLESVSRNFMRALTESSYPEAVIDAITSTITVLRSNTCFRVEDGTFFAYEGQFDQFGCCDGSCTHVWNYAQTLAFLFPELERSMRRVEFLIETDTEGGMKFRNRKYFGDPEFNMPPAADGQLGCVIRLYRDWMFSGDDYFLEELWPAAKRALEYAFVHWDKDQDGVIESEQHNTYDIEFYGANSMMNSIYYTALVAASKMAAYLGEQETAEYYLKLWEKGSQKLSKLTFNGEYFVQLTKDIDEYKYQYGEGCLADQLFGQQLAHLYGLGYVMELTQVKSAVKAIYQHNFRTDFSEHCNLQRAYALNQEPGLLLCTWPRGGRPQIPFVYCDEVWSGVEYQVATHLIYEGFVKEGIEIVKAARSRHDGIKRSPWNEVECGHHYARSLSSYGLLLALSGCQINGVSKKITFNPAINQDNFRTFFTCADGWGIYHQYRDSTNGELKYEVDTLYGSLEGYEVGHI